MEVDTVGGLLSEALPLERYLRSGDHFMVSSHPTTLRQRKSHGRMVPGDRGSVSPKTGGKVTWIKSIHYWKMKVIAQQGG